MPTERAEELANGAAVGNGRFAVVGTLGWGSQGRTYEAIDKTTGTVVALKRFSVRGATSWKDVELAEREASVLSGLEHPLLPKYLAHFEENGALYLAMERVEGPTLKQLREERKFNQSEVVAFLNDAALTLAYLHSRAPAVIHRDIKPANVIRRPDGRYALVDFGSVAHVFKPEGGSTVVGTFGYMAPEQFQGRAMPASDLYSVAATALAMLTGVDPEKLPHKGLGIDVSACLGPEIDSRLRDLLTGALDLDPDARSKASLEVRLKQQGLLVPVGSSFEQRPPHAAGAPEGRSGNTSHNDFFQAPEWSAGWQGAPRDFQHGAWQRPGSRSNQHQSARARRKGLRRRHRNGVPFPAAPILLVITMALLIARVATAAFMVLALPLLLTVLSFFFGPSLKLAARRVSLIGREGQAALRRASERIHLLAGGRFSDVIETEGAEVESHDEPIRTRAPAPKTRLRVEDLRHEPETETQHGVESKFVRELEKLEREIEDAAKSTRLK